jgi:uncharacterized repeat protein (TIGR01451 family)
MRRTSLIAVLVLATLALGVTGSPGAAAKQPSEKITICHATGNGKYVSITVSINGLNGHGNHEQDIIPPHGSEPGQNWDPEGQAIWENGCVEPSLPPDPPRYPIGVFAATACGSDGTYSATFGYTSENEVEVSVPVGADNFTSPGEIDQGQPTTFQPGTVTSAFTVTAIPGEITGHWTVHFGGETRTATVSRPAECGTPPPSPAAVSPSVACVDKGETTYTARFGYLNRGSATVSVPVGSENGFGPDPVDRGQPIAFEPGSDTAAVEVSGIRNGTRLVWTLKTGGKTRTATATDAFETPCTETPPPPVTKPVSIFVRCVDPGPTTFTATYGYLNPNAVPVTIAVGTDNRLNPLPADRGQPTAFVSGRVDSAFTVAGVLNGTNLVWILNGKTATAASSFPTRCSEPPPPILPPLPPLPPPQTDQPIGVFVTCVTLRGATYDATFGYQNDNRSAVTIPVGSNNRFAPAPADRGQETAFLPGNVQQAFTVRGVARSTQLTWTVTHDGSSRSATAAGSFERKCDGVPEPSGPIGLFACVSGQGSTYDVTFGYVNENPVAVSIPVGISNGILPAPVGRGQPELFLPGRVASAFTVKGVPAAQKIVWRVAHRGTTLLVASSSHPVRCGAPSRIPVEVFPLCALKQGSTYVAAFGYLNSGTATVRVRRGSQNAVSPSRYGGDQPEVFLPGLTVIAFAIPGVPLGEKVTWRVETLGQADTAVASSGLADCRTVAVGGTDLSITKVAEPAAVEVGDRVEFSIVVRNEGTIPAARVTVVDRPLDGRIDVLSATASQGTCEVRRTGSLGQRVVCRLQTVGPGDTARILVAARAVAPGVSRDIVSVLGVPAGGDASNNVASAVVTIRVSSGGGPSPPFTG